MKRPKDLLERYPAVWNLPDVARRRQADRELRGRSRSKGGAL